MFYLNFKILYYKFSEESSHFNKRSAKSTIKLKAIFTGDGAVQPTLDDWSVLVQ